MRQLDKHKFWVGFLLVGLAAALIIAAVFPGEVLHPNTYLNGTSGDAIKNYFVVEYYTHFDQGLRFTGMNYPYGEHVNFPDMQPLLALPLAWGRQLGLPLPDYGVGLINAGLLLALLAAALLLYAVLRRLALPAWYAGITALLITFMSPQLNRFQGHMSLGYACLVPVELYVLSRILQAPRQARWYWLLGTFNLLVGLLATYHLAINSFLLLALALVLGVQQGWRRTAPLLWRLAATGLVPLLAFGTWLRLTDHVADRPLNPYGVLVYRASFTGLFSPFEGPGRALWLQLFPSAEPQFEAANYVGFAGLLVLGLSGLLAVRYALRRQWGRLARPVLPTLLGSTLWASALLLVLAFAFFLWLPGLDGYVWLLGPLKQFRALGRFTWPFYYAFTLYTAYFLYRQWRYLRQHRRPLLAAAWLAPLLLVWGVEANWHLRPVGQGIADRPVKAEFEASTNNYQQMLTWTKYRASDFQAILPLPYFSIGTDKITREGSNQSSYQAYRAALNLHLPLLAAAMARSSVGQTLRVTQVMSGPLVPKAILADLPSAKPILLLVTPDALSPAEQRLVGLAHKIAESSFATLYELPLSALAATGLAAARARADSLLPRSAVPNQLVTSTGKGALYVPFDSSPDRRGRLAAGAFYEPAQKFSVLYDGPLPAPASDTSRYELSVWVNAQMRYGLGGLQLNLFRGGEQLAHLGVGGGGSSEILGDWVREVLVFKRPPGADRLEVLYDNQDLLADDLLVRPLDTDVYWRDARGRPILNGYPLLP